MDTNITARQFLLELESEVASTRKCLERLDEKLFDYQPHPTSMKMGYLAQIVAEIPKWIAATIEVGTIDFMTWEKYSLTTGADLVRFFDANVELARAALAKVSDEALEEMFHLKSGTQELMRSTKRVSIGSSINHLVHHRGQLTVYMRMNGIPVPSLYGPSADDKTFG